MCGLIHVKRLDKRSAVKHVIRKFDKQRSRGIEGFGYVALKEGVRVAFKKSETEDPIIAEMEKEDADEIMFHHRNPTSTPNLWEAAHPISVSNEDLQYDYYICHNGSIKNHEFLKKEHDKLKYAYTTEIKTVARTVLGNEKVISTTYNDSESFAIELARELDGACVGISRVYGNIAFLCLQMDKKTNKAVRLFYGRNLGSPLKIHQEDWYFSISSEGVGKDLNDHILNWYDYVDDSYHEKPFKIGISVAPATYSGYHSSDEFDQSALIASKVVAVGTPEWERDFENHLENIYCLEALDVALKDTTVGVLEKSYILKKKEDYVLKIVEYRKKYGTT